ncbi:hypothetical protein JoomaDRAFT_1951 [Galbibacter orientalis DSM 19592]|uniref:Uncharacterized protein n=1 Tax=Galbibacter orientalis DSM 19592 TaxID=926559 RepID=I3C5Q6_9FLAO|nr:hypothetical protein JoomaDRAFT_1951 [Galbibacter orientalis DSM 19592]
MKRYCLQFSSCAIYYELKYYLLGLFRITNAAITPGIQPQRVNKKTITIEPQPLSRTAKGGKKIESKTLQILIFYIFFD